MEPDGLYVPARVPWLPDLKAELLAFPRGRHDDIVDALGPRRSALGHVGSGRRAET